MQYILTQEELDNLVSLNEHRKVRDELLAALERANSYIIKEESTPCSKRSFVCDYCPLSIFGSNTCFKESAQRYSK